MKSTTHIKAVSRLAVGVSIVLLCLCPMLRMPAGAKSAPTLNTTLEDGAVQRGGIKTFDVWARDGEGRKIAAQVVFNGEILSPTWDDTDKTSYTLHFTREGANTVDVSTTDQGETVTLHYTLQYQKAEPGDVIGKATWSVELFTIGCGYLVEPVERDILEGENTAQALLRLLHDSGYIAFYGGSDQSAFYLAYIADGDNPNENYNGYRSSRLVYGVPASPKQLDLEPEIPAVLFSPLSRSMDYFDDQDYQNWTGTIGEFVFTNGSGWMYCINHVFPNVSFADSYLSDGDVIRVQLTLGFGADIGGASAMGGALPGSQAGVSSFFTVGDKDKLTQLIARSYSQRATPGVASPYAAAIAALETLDATQSQLDSAYNALLTALNSSHPAITLPTVSDTAGGSIAAASSAASLGDTPPVEGVNPLVSSSLDPMQSAQPFLTESDAVNATMDAVAQDHDNDKESDHDNNYNHNSAMSKESASSNSGSGWTAIIIFAVFILLIGGAVCGFLVCRNNGYLFWKKDEENLK